MRFILYILLIVPFFSCNYKRGNDHSKITVHANMIRSYDSIYINGDTNNLKTYSISLSVTNRWNRPISIWIMSCSWHENFIISKEYIKFNGFDCNHNVPKAIHLNPKDSVVYQTTISKHGFESKYSLEGSDTAENVKFGFVFVDAARVPTLEEYLSILDDRSKQGQIIWSNPLYLNNQK